MTLEPNATDAEPTNAVCPDCGQEGSITNVQEVEQEHIYPILGFDPNGEPRYGPRVITWTVYTLNEARCDQCGWEDDFDHWLTNL
ncbi:hypothetical protein [Nostocoides sp. HKS02]|uniref:hypothetical protein n=1 Tax=Nostocoides sp. HKS02 TaxID=1813880 RepID=UPI0012B498D5|nr:hypothetical protein [Tetrasphaera sp. HKS02]QGN58056.1 hypothetical protein GKE56_09335 [Tetrasphaera sp. HKS02]